MFSVTVFLLYLSWFYKKLANFSVCLF
jgi:hypothetical protein